jgi:hypothetical protein
MFRLKNKQILALILASDQKPISVSLYFDAQRHNHNNINRTLSIDAIQHDSYLVYFVAFNTFVVLLFDINFLGDNSCNESN